jgi:hypothetical protein
MAIPSAVAADLGVAAGTPTAWRSIIGPSPACFFMEKHGKTPEKPTCVNGNSRENGKKSMLFMGNWEKKTILFMGKWEKNDFVHGKMGKISILFMGKLRTVGEKQWEMAQWPMVKLPHVPLIYHGQSEWASIC